MNILVEVVRSSCRSQTAGKCNGLVKASVAQVGGRFFGFYPETELGLCKPGTMSNMARDSKDSRIGISLPMWRTGKEISPCDILGGLIGFFSLDYYNPQDIG